MENSEKFELPVDGSTGFTSIALTLKSDKDASSDTVNDIGPGEGFRILEEDSDWWMIKTKDMTGWVMHKYCMINLPDIIPSILYDNTNSYSAAFRSSGKAIPGLTGKKLYNAITNNDRFGEKLPLMPVIYSMSKKIYAAQKAALSNNESIVLIESYRPYEVQRKIVDALSSLMASDSKVNEGIDHPPWSQDWFIATGISNHQRGIAVDISLAKINKTIEVRIGDYTYKKVTEYDIYKMPSPIHELSVKSAAFTEPFEYGSPEQKTVSLSEKMNDAAIRLQNYCTVSGLLPLASEWWHFNDQETLDGLSGNESKGDFFVKECFSTI